MRLVTVPAIAVEHFQRFFVTDNLFMPTDTSNIQSPGDPQLDQLCDALSELASTLKQESNDPENWPREQLALIDQAGVNAWFVPESLGGAGWTGEQILAGYLKLSAACLTTTFIITQRAAAYRRIAVSSNHALRDALIDKIVAGQETATVGISHLTTSRRHTGKPALTATETESGYRLDGFSPWVTGGRGANHLVVGAELPDGRQILVAVPSDFPGVAIEPGFSLIALSASQTGAVRFHGTEIEHFHVLAGPVEEVLKTGSLGATGGSQTSGLAIGLAGAAIHFLETEAEKRPDLVDQYQTLQQQYEVARENLFAAASGSDRCTPETIRIEANSLVLRATQAALVAAKGTGFVTGHPVGRWCREALFFLVWSCPQAVAQANLCQLAGGSTADA